MARSRCSCDPPASKSSLRRVTWVVRDPVLFHATTCSSLSSYLNDLERITSLKYVPTDGELDDKVFDFHNVLTNISYLVDDVLKARLKTVGACEYKFHLEATAGTESGTEWRIIDVGGSRSQVRLYWCLNMH